jgi:hypothetical protein
MRPSAQVTGWGKYVPERILTNDDLSRMVDTSDEWIRSRTGIAARRIAGAHETTASMAVRAARQALAVAGLAPQKLDLIIVATATPEYSFPATACLVQDALGAAHAGAFDLSAGCTGFIYGLSVAAEMIAAGRYRNILVIGAETLSRIVNWRVGLGARRRRLGWAALDDSCRRVQASGKPGDYREGPALHPHGWPRSLPLCHAGHRAGGARRGRRGGGQAG